MNYYSFHYQLMSFAATEKRQIAQLNAETQRKCLRFELCKTDERDFIFKTSSILLPCKVMIHAVGLVGLTVLVERLTGGQGTSSSISGCHLHVKVSLSKIINPAGPHAEPPSCLVPAGPDVCGGCCNPLCRRVLG